MVTFTKCSELIPVNYFELSVTDFATENNRKLFLMMLGLKSYPCAVSLQN